MKILAADPSRTHHPDWDLALDPEWTTQILTRFIATELHRTGKRRLVLGLSGGIDSAVAVSLAARAIGPDLILSVLMPYRTSSPASVEHAQLLAEALGTRSETIEITQMVDGIRDASGDEMSNLRLGNVMARARMIALFDRSARDDALVLGTSNKTELLLGYGTLNGDLASALNPIGDLYKTQVRQLARYLGVPQPIIDKPPSADLWPDQSDEDDLGMTYSELDRMLAMHVDARVSEKRLLAEGFAPEMIDRVSRMIVRSQFKRRPTIIAKVSLRSIGWDFRYPRDWNS